MAKISIIPYNDISTIGLIPLPINASENNSFFLHSKNQIWSLNAINEKHEIIYNTWLIYEIDELKKIYTTQTKNIPEDILIGDNNNLYYDTIRNIVYILSGPRKTNILNISSLKNEYYLYSYNLKNDTWKLLSKFPTDLKFRQIITIFNDSLIALTYIVKKKYFINYQLSTNKYSLNEIKESIPDIGFSTLFVESKIVLYGGIDKHKFCPNTIWFIDPIKFNIIESYNINNIEPRTFSFSCYINHNKTILFYGGTTNGYDFTDSGFSFNIIEKSTKPINKLFNCNSLFKFNFNEIKQELFLIKCMNYDPKLRNYYSKFSEIKMVNINQIFIE